MLIHRLLPAESGKVCSQPICLHDYLYLVSITFYFVEAIIIYEREFSRLFLLTLEKNHQRLNNV